MFAAKKITLLPDTFASAEEAGEFWDAHSTADYEEYLIPTDLTIDIRKRHYVIEIEQDTFMTLCQYSKQIQQPVDRLANGILKERLISIVNG